MFNKHSSFNSILFVLLIISFGITQKNLEIFLLIGQSNMAGRAAIDPSISQDTSKIINTWLFKDSADWVPAKNPLNLYSTHRKNVNQQRIGPGYGFSLRIQKALPEKQIGLVVQARGGTSIDLWKRGNELYDNAVKKALQAKESGTLKAVLWHQGESDNGSADTYLEKLIVLITSLREDLGLDSLPFIAGQLLNISSKYDPINSIITDLTGLVPHTGVVLTDGTMGSFDGGTHFDRNGQLELGTRYAEKVLLMGILEKSTGNLVKPYSMATPSEVQILNGFTGGNILIGLNGKFYNTMGRKQVVK